MNISMQHLFQEYETLLDTFRTNTLNTSVVNYKMVKLLVGVKN